MKYLLTRLSTLLLAAIVGLMVASSAFGTATIQILNNDVAGVGFNDTTPATPVGGNNGTTVGEQRLIAFQAAANIWGATLTSGPIIVIRAQWASFASCTATSGTLGSAGNTGAIWREFPGSVPGFWYGNALANALRNTDLNGATPEINATFNVNLGTPGCLQDLHWYYGLDNNHGANGVDLVSVLLHEFGHGLGFQTFTRSDTGAQAGSPNGFPSIYDRFLFDNTTGKTWPQMTDAERQASAINTNNLVWNGPQVTSDVPGVLSSAGTPRLRVNSPAGIAGNYTVGTATFGPALTSAGVTGTVIQAEDPSDGVGALTTDGCSPLTNAGAVAGKIALIDRGTCPFVTKAKNAQDAGAVGVIIANNVSSSSPPGMSGSDPTITIPTVSITLADGNKIKAQLGSGVNATLLLDTSTFAGADQLGHALMFAPNPVSIGSSVSHWDTSAFPNQLMEPNISQDLSHSVTTPQDLTFSLMRDLGWCFGCPQPPPPSPTPTPSPPANDNFANAQAISGCSGSVTGTNVGGTHESLEPSHDSASPPDPGGSSVWYQWQAPVAGSVTITTEGSDYDTMLGVYTGTSVGSLTTIAKNDDVNPGVVTTSTVTFTATAGTTYKIAVDGWGGDTGNIKLNWTESNCTLTYSVSGRVADASNNSISGVTILFEMNFQGTMTTKSVQTDANGNYSSGDVGCQNNVKVTPSKVGYGFTPLSVAFVNSSACLNGSATANFTGALQGPTIFIEEGTANQAVALDSVTFVRGPFPIMSFFNFSSPDNHTRVILFTSDLGLTLPDPSKLTVTAGGTSLTVENVGPVMGVTGLVASYIVVRLPDGLLSGNLPLIVTLNGVTSTNTPTLGILP